MPQDATEKGSTLLSFAQPTSSHADAPRLRAAARCSMPPARAPCCVRGSGSTHCRAFNEAQAVRRFHRVLAAAYWDRIVAILLDQPTRSKNYDRRGTQRPDEIGTRSTVLPSRAAYEPWASVISLLPQARPSRAAYAMRRPHGRCVCRKPRPFDDRIAYTSATMVALIFLFGRAFTRIAPTKRTSK
jgi:hypothetical protein